MINSGPIMVVRECSNGEVAVLMLKGFVAGKRLKEAVAEEERLLIE